MKKRLLIILILLLIITGCKSKEKNIPVKKEKEKTEIKEEIPKYKDENNTPISFYEINNNTLTKIHSINKKLILEEDMGVFSIYPSNEETITLNDTYANSFYNEWTKYNQNNLKIGFNIKFNDISFNILNPNNCMDKWEYLYTYLYDDYANRGKNFYSHIENNEYNENTLFTSIKLQSGSKCTEILPKLDLTVFTYDSEDDFENNEYRGNSKYTMTINTN